MKHKRVDFAPIFRSREQGQLLALLYLNPDSEFTQKQLVERTDAGRTTIYREVKQLVGNGYLNERTSGRNLYVSANKDHPLFRHVAAIALYTFGPVALLPDLLAAVDGVEEAWVYGSWARRYEGEPIPDVQDIDLLVIGDVQRNDLYEMAQAAEPMLHFEVNPQPMKRERFESGQDPYTKSVRESPRVLVYRNKAGS